MSSPLSPSGPVLDHIVILVSYDALTNLPAWLTKALTVLPGGKHSDGLTENKLVVFEDRVYIELIAFVPGCDPEKRAAHRWGCKKEGTVVDFACTMLIRQGLRSKQRFAKVSKRVNGAQTGFEYPTPVLGGRTTPDGTSLEWYISAPEVSNEGSTLGLKLSGGELPFWCLDRTPRRSRVPYEHAENVKHPCGAVGVASVSISSKGPEKVARLRQVYDAITGEPSALVAVEPADEGYQWEIDSPSPATTSKSALILQESSDEEVSIRLALFTKETGGQLEGDLGDGQKLVIDLIPLADRDESWDWL